MTNIADKLQASTPDDYEADPRKVVLLEPPNVVSPCEHGSVREDVHHGSRPVSRGNSIRLTQNVAHGSHFASRAGCEQVRQKPRAYDSSLARDLKRGLPSNATRLERLLWQAAHGYYMSHSHRAAIIARDHNVSLATAFRHLRSGTTPARERRIGRDGKTYPAPEPTTRQTAVSKELRLASQSIVRAKRKAVAKGVHADELAQLIELVRMAQKLISEWRLA